MTTAPVDIAGIEQYLTVLALHNATDLHLTAGAPPLLRIDGKLSPIDQPPLTADQVAELVLGLLDPELVTRFHDEKEIDFSFSWRDEIRFRANVFRQQGTVALALRAIPFDIPSFDELGLPPIMEYFAGLPQGLLLVTGPTGSGKSTTQASVIDFINHNRECHILTIEDPIEYVHVHRRSAVNQREVGIDTDSFERALRSALREDPDVILVGEMRDAETMQFALTIAETGHLVFATLHTNDAATALDRIVDVFPADRQAQIRVQLAAALAGVVSQRLIPRIGGGMRPGSRGAQRPIRWARRSPSTRCTSAHGGVAPTTRCSGTARSPGRSPSTASAWASPTSSFCHSPSIPSAARGATR